MEQKQCSKYMNWGMVKIILALAWPTVVEQAMQTAVLSIPPAFMW